MPRTTKPSSSTGPGRAQGLSPQAARILKEAARALDARRMAEADRALMAVLALAPACVDALRLLGRMQHMRGERTPALESLQRAIELAPDDPLVCIDLGIALFECGQAAQAVASFQRACELAPQIAPAWFNLGRTLKLQGENDAAAQALHRALELDAAHAPAQLLLADIHTSRGDAGAAAAGYRQILRHHPAHAHAWLGLANLKVEKFDAADVSRIQRALRQPAASDEARAALGFSLARAYEDQGDYPASFQALCQANALRRRHTPWNAAEFSATVDATIAAFDVPAPPAANRCLGSQIIFVTGLPRSGSSLAEHILASHPMVEGGGEITDLQRVIDAESQRRKRPFPHWTKDADARDWERLGREYLARTAHLRRQGAKSTDKNLLNWQLLGAVRAMLPAATIIDCRRDPLETCLGCFRQWFKTGNGFTYDLDDMARYWRDYDRLSRHWQALFPGTIHEHRHEALLADPEGEIRRLLAAVGLEYDPACLQFQHNGRSISTASAVQVRQPLQRDTSRGAHYGDMLDRLRLALGSAAG